MTLHPLSLLCRHVVPAVLAATLTLGAAAQAQPVSCMVLGPATARVKAVEGERSPVFSTQDCQALRLLAGAARASWIGSDGKPHLVPITAQGVARAPQPGSETRSVNLVWSELSTRREQAQPAYMRSVGFERPLRVHVPADGLPLPSVGESEARLRVLREVAPATAGGEPRTEVVAEITVPGGQPVRVPASAFQPDQTYRLQVQRGDTEQAWRWRTVTAATAAEVEARRAEIAAEVADAQQRTMLEAMLYEQLKLRPNMDLLVQQIRAAGF
ncbi:hypothetical protein AACH10_11480 [Ideonella sp. DXS22W]|uniref:Uncharacterized protein n=1 Tax=Pseudaquabacterium inlustre TaxID=2984192 RepID=A0ABU9CG63_9BURK